MYKKLVIIVVLFAASTLAFAEDFLPLGKEQISHQKGFTWQISEKATQNGWRIDSQPPANSNAEILPATKLDVTVYHQEGTPDALDFDNSLFVSNEYYIADGKLKISTEISSRLRQFIPSSNFHKTKDNTYLCTTSVSEPEKCSFSVS